jgi:hypothetical protein
MANGLRRASRSIASSARPTWWSNPGKENMTMTLKDGEELERYELSGQIGEGAGSKRAITDRLPDGPLIQMPKQAIQNKFGPLPIS